MSIHKPGDRVFFVTEPNKLGTVVQQTVTSQGTRVIVLWDDTGITTSWDPVFIFPFDTPSDKIPAVIESGEWKWYKTTNNLTRTVTHRRYGGRRH